MENSIRLKRVLICNAVFSAIAGLLMIILNSQFVQIFGIVNGLVFYILGPGLILFGIDVAYVAIKQINNPKRVKGISFMDFGWVLGSLIIIVTTAFNLSWIGYELIGIVAAIVFTFGFLQLKFNR